MEVMLTLVVVRQQQTPVNQVGRSANFDQDCGESVDAGDEGDPGVRSMRSHAEKCTCGTVLSSL
jgi:hypothetical protein